MVKCGSEIVLFAYEWKLDDQEIASDLVCMAHKNSTEADNYMLEQSLHCTSYVNIGQDREFEKGWFEDVKSEGLRMEYMYWTDKMAAVSVSLSPSQEKVFHGTTPHISLAKPADFSWQDLGPWLQDCLCLTDFEPVTGDLQVEYSAQGKVCRSKLDNTVLVQRSVELVEEQGKCIDLFTLAETEEIPELTDIPPALWATHKYDVGLIKNVEPLVVRPKSNYRPCLKQYPLKKEAVEGITPVFESLLQSGIIISCDSPVRTPIFPVKKIQEEGRPTNWRFVQDLKAVNSAVYQPAPEVSNPHTILTLVPPESTHFSVVDLANAFFLCQCIKTASFGSPSPSREGVSPGLDSHRGFMPVPVNFTRRWHGI